MANYTATTSMSLEAAIAAGSMVDGEDLTINNGAVITCTQSPSILMGNITINDGELFVDGKNISSGNIIHFIGELAQTLYLHSNGKLSTDGDWYSLGTTDGTNDQSIDLSSYWGGTLEGCVPAIWIETGRRIYFDNVSSTEEPQEYDWVYLASDNTVRGRIIEYNSSSSYMIVKFLTGVLADDDVIMVDKVVQNNGPDLQTIWSAQVNNASGDIKEAGIYQAFGNVRSNGVSYFSDFGDGIGGFIFDHAFQGTSLTLAGTAGGFIPPSGCDIRIPNIAFSTALLSDYQSGLTTHATSYSNTWELFTTYSGSVDLSITNIGLCSFASNNAFQFDAVSVGSCLSLGSIEPANNVSFYDCVVVNDPAGTISRLYSFCTESIATGAVIDDCLVLNPNWQTRIRLMQSYNITIKNCILVSRSYQIIDVDYVDNLTIDNCVVILGSGAYETIDLSYCTNVTINNIYFSLTKDYTFATAYAELLRATAASYGVTIIGITMLGNGGSPDTIIHLYYGYGIKIRCFGKIDDKVDFDSQGGNFLYSDRWSYDVDIARVWVKNQKLLGGYPMHLFQYTPQSDNIRGTNCSGSYNSSMYISAKTNSLFRGYQSGSNGIAGNLYGGILTNPIYQNGAYGRQIHDVFTSDTTGQILSLFVYPSNAVNNVSIVSGEKIFQKDGSVDFISGDQIIVEQDYYSKGHIAFTGNYTISRGGVFGVDVSSNITVEFQYDTGSGYNGTWLDITVPSNLTSITGMSDGIKVKFRITATGTENGILYIALETSTSIAVQKANLYAIDQNYVTVKVIVKDVDTKQPIENAYVYLLADTGGDLSEGAIVVNGLTNSTGYIQDTEFLYTSNQPIIGSVRKSTSGALYKPQSISSTITNTGIEIVVLMVPD